MHTLEQDKQEKEIAALEADIALLRYTIDRMVDMRMSPRAVREARDRCYVQLDGPAFVPSDPLS